MNFSSLNDTLDFLSLKKAALIIFLISALVGVSVTAFSYKTAIAQSSTTITTTALSGGTLNCLSDSTPAAAIEFNATKWAINTPSNTHALSGIITNVQRGISNYTLTGIQTSDTPAPNYCGIYGLPSPANITISAPCGDNVPVTFTGSNDDNGTFMGDVLCAALQTSSSPPIPVISSSAPRNIVNQSQPTVPTEPAPIPTTGNNNTFRYENSTLGIKLDLPSGNWSVISSPNDRISLVAPPPSFNPVRSGNNSTSTEAATTTTTIITKKSFSLQL